MDATDARQPGAAVLRIRSLCKTYGSGETAVHALRDVSLEVRSGEFIVLCWARRAAASPPC